MVLLFVTSSSIVQINAVEVVEAVFELGEVLLIRPKTPNYSDYERLADNGMYRRNFGWRILNIESDEYITADNTNTEIMFCTPENGCRYDRLKNLSIRKINQKVFPSYLFDLPVFRKLQNLRMSGLGLTEFSGEFTNIDSGSNIESELIALNVLDLSHNAITQIPAYAFEAVRNITEIDLIKSRKWLQMFSKPEKNLNCQIPISLKGT